MKCGREEKGDKSEVGVGKTETLNRRTKRSPLRRPNVCGLLECTSSVAGRHRHARSLLIGKLYVQSVPFLSPQPSFSISDIRTISPLHRVRFHPIARRNPRLSKGIPKPRDPDPLRSRRKRGLSVPFLQPNLQKLFPMALKNPTPQPKGS